MRRSARLVNRSKPSAVDVEALPQSSRKHRLQYPLTDDPYDEARYQLIAAYSAIIGRHVYIAEIGCVMRCRGASDTSEASSFRACLNQKVDGVCVAVGPVRDSDEEASLTLFQQLRRGVLEPEVESSADGRRTTGVIGRVDRGVVKVREQEKRQEVIDLTDED